MADTNSLKQTFDQVALLYNAARPRYPDELFSTLIDVARLPEGVKLLEIGPGTGQATKPLAHRGFDVTAIELGPALAEVAKHELRDYKNANILTGAFEDTHWPSASFDLVFAATAFHWIDPLLRYSKSHEVLKPEGHLAIIHTHHISDEKGDDFFNASQPVFDRYDFTDKHRKPELPRNRDLKADDIDENIFKLVHFQTFPVVITYSARSFVQLLNTYSNHLAAPQEVQQAFYGEIENLINDRYQGKVDKHFSMSLTVGKKV